MAAPVVSPRFRGDGIDAVFGFWGKAELTPGVRHNAGLGWVIPVAACLGSFYVNFKNHLVMMTKGPGD